MSEKRLCLHCRCPLPAKATANQKYHSHLPQCQAARKRNNQRRSNYQRTGLKRRNNGETVICSVCQEPFDLLPGSNLGRKTCYRDECVKARRVAATTQSRQKEREKMREVECLRCSKGFQTPLDKRGVPIYRLCPDCHHYISEERSFAEVWG